MKSLAIPVYTIIMTLFNMILLLSLFTPQEDIAIGPLYIISIIVYTSY